MRDHAAEATLGSPTSGETLISREACFNTTHWSVVLLAGHQASPQSREALETLCRVYWNPIFFFTRRHGYSEEDARDLTQKFFALLLERDDLGRVDPRKGRFRTFLLASLTHFLSNERDYARAAKRGGGREHVSLDELDPEGGWLTGPSPELSPDRLFDQRWAMAILESALARLQAELCRPGKQKHFETLRGYLTEEPEEGDYEAAARQLAVTSQAVAVRVHRMRQRFRELVRSAVAQTVSGPNELDGEMQHLFQALLGSA